MATARKLSSVTVEPVTSSESYQFKPGEKLRGFYVGSRKTQTQYGEGVIHTLNDGKKDVDVFESATLRNLSLVKKGAVVEIKFLGKRKGKGGQRYNNFSLAVEPGGLTRRPVFEDRKSRKAKRTKRGRK